jgi:hypothetical protein
MNEGKAIGREDPEIQVDQLPVFVEFVPFDSTDDGTLVRGSFRYIEPQATKLRQAFTRLLAGETLFSLASELGYASSMALRRSMTNPWCQGIKHRTRHVGNKEWSPELNRFRMREIERHQDAIEVATNLAATPLVSKQVFDAVQTKLAKNVGEYSKRKKLVDGFLANPLLHCPVCNGRMYGRRASGGRIDYYECRNRTSYRHKDTPKCEGDCLRANDFDVDLGLQFVWVMLQPGYMESRVQEQISEPEKAQKKVALEAKQRMVAELEKKAARVRSAIIETDDAGLAVRLKEINLELASSRQEASKMEAEIASIPVVNMQELRRDIINDLGFFVQKPRDEQKRILAKYISSMTGTKTNDKTVGRRFKVKFQFKIGAPVVEQTSEPWHASVKEPRAVASYRKSESPSTASCWRCDG